MTDNQLVTMFETLLDSKLTPYFEKMNIRLDRIEERLDKIETHLIVIDEHLLSHDNMFKVIKIRVDMTNKKLNNLTLAVKVLDHNIGKEIHALKDTQDTVVAVLQARNILPLTNDLIKQIC